MEMKDIQTKSTRDLLDELKELYKGGYVTEGEFKIARTNVLKEAGFDVVTQLHQYHRQLSVQEEEEEPSGRGCGCFLATLLLTAFLALGVSYFAAPYWPADYGGAEARAAREWVSAQMKFGTDFIARFFSDSADSTQIPDPIPSSEERQEGDPFDITGPASPDEPAELTSTGIEEAVPPPPAAPGASQIIFSPSADMHILSQPAEPYIAAVEIQTPASEELGPAVLPGAENALRGYVTASNARIRSAPDTSTNDNVVGWGRNGDRFIVLEEGSGIDGSKWYNIMRENGNRRGWISGSLVRLEE